MFGWDVPESMINLEIWQMVLSDSSVVAAHAPDGHPSVCAPFHVLAAPGGDGI